MRTADAWGGGKKPAGPPVFFPPPPATPTPHLPSPNRPPPDQYAEQACGLLFRLLTAQGAARKIIAPGRVPPIPSQVTSDRALLAGSITQGPALRAATPPIICALKLGSIDYYRSKSFRWN